MSGNKLGLSQNLASLAEGLLPWQLTGSQLGAGEDDELAKRRAMPVTLTGQKDSKQMYTVRYKRHTNDPRAVPGQEWENVFDNIDYARLKWDTEKRNGMQMLTERPSSSDSKGKSMAGKSIIEAAKKGLTLVKGNPTVMAKVNDYYKSATGTNLNGSNLIKGPAPAAVILKGLVRAGVNPSDVFDGVILREQADTATAAIMDDLRNVFNSMTSALDSKAAIHSEGGLGPALLRKEVILFAQRSFGSVQAIREAHAKMRAFLEMDTRTLEETLALHLGR